MIVSINCCCHIQNVIVAFFFIAITFGFQMQVFNLMEDSGDTSVVFGKVNGTTELTLAVMIDFDSTSVGVMEGSVNFIHARLI